VIPLTPQQQAQFDKGKLVFAQICAACHQPTGLGQDGLAPPLVDSEWVLGSDRRITRIVFQGLTGPITVNGVSFQLEMPALTTLGDEDVAAVLTYIRREWEHNAAPVPVEAVERVRDQIKTRTEPWTAKELMQVK
jgi:mono/diheme cytochrome c family protein